MSSFTAPIQVEIVGNRQFRVLRNIRFYLNEPDGDYVLVPAGEINDGNSIPRFLWWLLGHPLWWMRSGAIHDWLYKKQFVWRRRGDTWVKERITRQEADAIYRLALGVEGAPVWHRFVRWTGVSTCGWKRWAQRRRELENT